MRYSYSKKLISEERRQRGPHYGHAAQLRQLTALTCLLLGLYTLCSYNVWRHPRPVHHVWIDGVLVEVVEENWIDHARNGLLYSGLGCAALLGLFRLCFGSGVERVSAAAPISRHDEEGLPYARESGRGDAAGGPSPQSTMKDISTIAAPGWSKRRSAQPQPPLPTSRYPFDATSSEMPPPLAAGAADRTRAFDAQRPMRSTKDLNLFLAYEAAQQQQQQQRRSAGTAVDRDGNSYGHILNSGGNASSNTNVRYRGAGLGEDNFYANEGDVPMRDALSVTYEGRGASSRRTATASGGLSALPGNPPLSGGFRQANPPSTLPWAALGITHLEEALQRTREWVSDVCRRLVDDIDQCDRWFSAQQIEAYDCLHSLQEQQPAPVAAPAVGGIGTMAAGSGAGGRLGGGFGGAWGAGGGGGVFGAAAGGASAAGAAAVPQLESKLAALLRAKANCRQSQQGIQELDTTLRYDQRLTLEARLDISGTFSTSAAAATARVSNAELTAQREYVVDRLRTFAKQRFLVSYNASGGDAETWRSGYPCDAHLLLHVLRSSVKGFSEYVRFGYQSGVPSQDLALYVGDTGEPYFYVRFRQGSGETLLSTRQGATSLFEAVLAFAAVIHVYYHDIYGGIRGTVDLAEVGLLKVVTESRRPAW